MEEIDENQERGLDLIWRIWNMSEEEFDKEMEIWDAEEKEKQKAINKKVREQTITVHDLIRYLSTFDKHLLVVGFNDEFCSPTPITYDGIEYANDVDAIIIY